MWHARGWFYRSVFSSNPYIDSCRIRGKKMATIPMIPVGPVTTLNRSILLTERGMSGDGGDDCICGHCGSVIWRISILQQLKAILSTNAASLKTTMTCHSLRVMVATGPPGDPDRNQSATGWWDRTTTTDRPPRNRSTRDDGKPKPRPGGTPRFPSWRLVFGGS